jgi:hypothetical protein
VTADTAKAVGKLGHEVRKKASSSNMAKSYVGAVESVIKTVKRR